MKKKKSRSTRSLSVKKIGVEPDSILAELEDESVSPTEALINCTQPLLELFAVADDVFTEHDAFDPQKIKSGFPRLYRAWKDCRKQIDPNFEERKYEHLNGS